MTEEREKDDAAKRDERGSIPPEREGEGDPTPGADGGPQGNPGQDEEALAERQQEAAEG